jgi:hypothetical protein
MSKLDIKLVEKMYADYGQELTPDRIEYIKGEFSNNNDFSNSFLRKYDPEKSASEIKVEKKNPDTTGTSSVAQSDSQEPPKKKSTLSVGGKPIQAGDSGSSVGKNKGERSSEQLLSELGFKNKEEQKKAGAVASKVKVGGATPVGVKSTPKKEEVFKTEKQKAVEKEGSLITEKYKREEEEKFVENFRGATALPEGYEDQVKEDINSELQGTGFWNTISQGASEAWNKVLPYIPGAPSSESELKQLESEVTFLPKAKEEYRAILIKQGVNKDEITDEVLTKGAIDLEVKKRVEDKKLSLANDYLDNLPNDIKSRMESKALNEVQINNPEVTKGFNLLKTLDADIKKDNDELVKLEELSKKNNGLSPEDADRYGSLTASLKSKIESRNKQYNSYKEKVSKLTTAEQEYDLFKRTYGFEDKAGKILNSVADFGLGAVQFMNMLTPGANQDNIALELAGIKSKKDKLVAEKFQKQVDDAKNINDVLDYGSDVLISQTPNIALGYLTGGTSMMVGIGTSAAGNRYSELLKSNMDGETDYSKLQMYLSSGIYGASEMIESNTMKMIGGAKNVIGKAIKNEPSRKLFTEGLATKTYKTGKEFFKNYKGEFKQEFTTLTSKKISDIVVLDIDSKDVFKNAKEEIKSLVKDTGVMVVGLNLFPATFAKVVNTFSPKDYTYNLDKNNKMIDDLSKILNNKDASDVVKSEAKNKIDQIVKSNEEGLIKVVKNTSKLDDKLVDKVVEIEIKNSELRNKANQINEDKTISKDQKKILLSGLKDEFTKNELLREDIVGGRKSSFDILPEDQSTKFKEEAANVLKKEELDKGVEENKINISAEDINNKAKELYNQKINKENEKSTRETDTEEKPTGTNTEQTTSAVQQKDGNAELQKEVDKLREEEIKELTENVENPEGFITDGKVDAKKVSESDNAKAKEIYAKYDKLIKPLLSNIKTQELNSVLKDKSGKSKRFYHGSINKIVGDFENRNTNIDGFFFSSDIDNAKTYGENIEEVSLNIKNPLIIDSDGLKFTDDIPIKVIAKYPGQEEYETTIPLGIDEIVYMVKNGKRKNSFIEIKDRESYDGVVFKNIIDPSLSSKREVPQDTVVVFNNDQILRTKTQEDAVQKQSTNEGLLQPEQSEMGLQKMDQGNTEQEVVAEQSKEKVSTKITTLPTKVTEKLTENENGDYVFKHYSDQKRDVIKKGQGQNKITSREESSALSSVGGLAMFYTMEGQKETGVGNVENTITVPKDKVYDIDSDPLGFEGEAKKRFNEARPGQAFTNNYRGAFITQIANENGFDIAVSQWRGSELRAQTTKELPVSNDQTSFKERPLPTFKVGDKAIIDGKESVIEKVDGEKLTYKSLDGTASGVTLNNERNRRSVIKIERDVELKEEVNKALDRLSKAYDAYKNVNVIFDPEGQWKKDKELVSSLVAYAVSNIKLGAYNASNLLKDLKSKGFDITKEAAEFIFQKASGPSPKERTSNTKAEVTELKGQMQDLLSSAKEALKIEKDKSKVINKLKGDVNNFVKVSIQDLKAGDIGKRALTSIASKVQQITDQNFEEKLGEINDILSNLYTNRDVNKAKSDKKKALKNVMSGKVGKLDKRGDRDKVMSSKIVNFALLNPETLKKVLDDATFGLYTDYINRLGERKDALSDTDLKSYEKLYDEITIPYKKYTDKVNEIQGKIDTNQDLSDSEQKFVEENKSDFYEKEDVAGDEEADAEKKAKKEAEILKKKEEIKSFIPLMKDVFQQSNAEKGSFEWKILSTLVNLDASDVDSMPDNMLTNAINALRSMVDNDVVPTYAEDLYRYTIKNKAKNLLAETVSKAGKGGLYKTKVGRAVLKAREILGNPLTTIRGLKNGDVDAELLEKRIKMFRLSAIDAALKIYGDTPIFDGIMSVLGKGMSNLASTEARAEEALLNAKKLIDRKSKNPQESYMKITYHLIDAMAKNNQGTKSDVEAMEYFEKTVSDPNSKIRENKKALKVVEDFIAKVKGDNGVVNLTPDEATAANAIRIVLEENQINAYEANLFQNANAAPMISEYFPVSNSLKSQTDTDIKNMQSRFALNGAVSTKSGNLEEKSGKAHPIDMNPFTTAFSSIKNTAVQFNLRSEYLGISGGLQEAINEAVENGDRDSELFLNGIRKALESEFDLIINGASFGSNNLMDDVFNAVDRTFYQVMLGSVISRSVDFTGNLIQLAALNPKLLVSGSKILKDLRVIKEVGESEADLLRGFYKNAEASDINKMISAKNTTTERTEFLNKGVSKSVLSKGLPTLNIFSKPKAKVIDPIDEKLTGINEGLISMSDVKPYGIAWNSIFRDAFLKEAGQEVDVAKIARGDKEYLKANKESIRKASNQANRESADLFGSTNPFERQIGIMEVAAGKKNSRNPLSALYNRAKYFLSGFTIGANTSMTTSINTFVENQDPRELRKALGGAVRMGMYTTTVSAISSLLWSLFKGDDEDEDKLAESFDRLSEDDKFIKKMNNLFLDFPIQKDRDGNQVKLSIEDFKKYNKLRDELLSNEDFKNAYDIYYKYINRNLFDNAVRLRANELNSTKKKLFKEDIIVFFDDIKNGFPKTDQEIINALAIMHSEEGVKLFTSEEVDGYILDIENHMAKIGFLDKRALRSADSQIDRMIINETAMLLSEHRNSSVSDIVVEEGAKLLMGLMFPRSNNLIKGSYNYLAEGANKMMIQSRRGDRGYDLYKDMIFQPVVKYGLLDKSDNIDIIGDSFGILNPALKDLAKRDNKDAATVSLLRYIKTVGTIGLNDFNKINSKMKDDKVYQKTNGRFKENIINDIAKDKVDIIRGVTDKEGLEEDLKNKEAYKSRVLPGLESTEVKSKLPSYMDKKDLKINGRSVE